LSLGRRCRKFSVAPGGAGKPAGPARLLAAASKAILRVGMGPPRAVVGPREERDAVAQGAREKHRGERTSDDSAVVAASQRPRAGVPKIRSAALAGVTRRRSMRGEPTPAVLQPRKDNEFDRREGYRAQRNTTQRKALNYSGRVSHHTRVHSPRMDIILCRKKLYEEARVSTQGWDSITHTYNMCPYGQRT